MVRTLGVAAGRDDTVPGVTTSYTVGELTEQLGEALAQRFPDDVWVTGEIRDLSRSAAGHVYFQLVEASPTSPQRVDASLAVVLFDANRRAVNAMLKRTKSVRMTDGVQVRIRAEVVFYPPQGKLQLRMVGIDPRHTLGALEAEREQVLRALSAEGLLDRNAQQPFPLVPHTVGLITSVGSAAHADFVHELELSAMSWRVVVADVRVQGRRAEVSIGAAIEELDQRDLDVIAIVRGGGARTDLAAFDHETIARAIAACSTPVVTGIGHEVDTSVADAVAAVAYKTPTACAAALVSLGREALARGAELWAAIDTRAGVLLDAETARLRRHAGLVASSTRHGLDAGARATDVARHRLAREVEHALGRSTVELDHRATQLAGAGRRHLRHVEADLDRRVSALVARTPLVLEHLERSLAGHEARARALDPARALARGWSITRTPDGRVVRSIADAEPSHELVTQLADGSVVSRVAHRIPAEGATDGDR
jgi:exodeoxyribonuclease VII large subunit